MPLWQAIVLGAVQGITEFLPISSTAHLALVPWLFRWEDPGLTFDVALHVGTLVAVLLYFYKTWLNLLLLGIGGTPRFGRENSTAENNALLDLDRNRALFWFLVVATIPAAVAGWLLQEQVATTLRHPIVIGAAMVLVALPMAWGERVSRFQKQLPAVSFRDALWIGCSQALALVPGVSRSGITMTTALFRDFRRDAAARFSFLLSTPIIAGAALKETLPLLQQGVPPHMLIPFLAGVLASALVGYASIAFFLKYLQFNTFKIFIYYRISFGMIILTLAFFYRLNIAS